MARTNASLLIDNEDLGQWQNPTFRSHWRNETKLYGSLALMDSALVTTSSKSTSNITIEFDGSSMSLFGISPQGKAWDLHTMLDGKAQTYHIPPNPFWGKWHQTDSVLPDFRKLELSNIPDGIYLDYVVAHPPFKNDINEQTLIVDDTDPIIQYSGVGWQESTEKFFVLPDTPVDAYGETTHVSSTVGDVLRFPFTGSTLSVYGFAIMNIPGNVTVSFQVDDSAPIIKKLPPPRDSVGSSDAVIPNYLYMDQNLKAGNHVLTVNITKVQGNQRFILDYILYETSFSSLDTMPVIQLPPLPSSSISSSKSSPTSSGPTHATSQSKTSKIVGGAVGSIAGFLLIIAAIFFILRRRKRRRTERLIAPFVDLESRSGFVAGEKQQENPGNVSTLPPTTSSPGSSEELGSPTNNFSPEESNGDRQRVLELERRIDELMEERQPPPRYSAVTLPGRSPSTNRDTRNSSFSTRNY